MSLFLEQSNNDDSILIQLNFRFFQTLFYIYMYTEINYKVQFYSFYNKYRVRVVSYMYVDYTFIAVTCSR